MQTRLKVLNTFLLYFSIIYIITLNAQTKPNITNEGWETPTGEWVVVLAEGASLEDIISPLNGRRDQQIAFLPNTYLVDFSASRQSRENITASLRTNQDIVRFEQQFARQMVSRNLNDPRIGDQWHLNNTGQRGGLAGIDVNVFAAWNLGYDGSGVQICIVDDGLEKDHEDLSANFKLADSRDLNGNNGNDPSPTSNNGHGTACAGVAAAKGNNGIGVAGAAHNANLSGVRLIAAANTDADEATALTYSNQNNDIYSNSWGPIDNGVYSAPGTFAKLALKDGAENGRGGLGNIYTWAAGNGRNNSDNSNYDGWVNSIYTIGVGAHGNDGVVSWYSEPGASMLISTPSNGGPAGITTTDLNDGYRDNFGGTSSATPLASGIIALMLDANPNLTWRDVQYILVEQAQMIDASNTDWTTNGVGKAINHNYGFGRVDAAMVAQAAASWTTVPMVTSDSSAIVNVNRAIPDGTSASVYGPSITESINISNDITLEQVELKVNFTHTYRGDIRVRLTSPAGTESVLALQHNDASDNLTDWYYMTVRNWGESSVGTWTIEVDDGYNIDVGTWVDFQLILHGVPASSGCPINLNITDTPISSDTYEASQRITSTGTIATGENVIFQAGDSIILSPGFIANVGSNFLAQIQGCTNALQEPTISYQQRQLPVQEATILLEDKLSLSVYPNPVSSTTNLAIHLPVREKISLHLYDALGQRVKTIIAPTFKEAGTHLLPLSIDDAFENGIYLAVLRTDQQQISKKISVLK